jgi:hypothetical protein
MVKDLRDPWVRGCSSDMDRHGRSEAAKRKKGDTRLGHNPAGAAKGLLIGVISF